MAKLTILERIAQLDARSQALRARLAKEDRAKDTRRKVLLGALLLDAIERGAAGQGRIEDRDDASRLTDWIRRELPGFLTRPIDRTLFPEFIDQATLPAAIASTSASSDVASPDDAGSTTVIERQFGEEQESRVTP